MLKRETEALVSSTRATLARAQQAHSRALIAKEAAAFLIEDAAQAKAKSQQDREQRRRLREKKNTAGSRNIFRRRTWPYQVTVLPFLAERHVTVISQRSPISVWLQVPSGSLLRFGNFSSLLF